jgi:hypothetical protein
MSPARERRASHLEGGFDVQDLFAALTLATLAACGGDRRDVAAADSLSRDLQLAPVDTTAELNDQPRPRRDRSPGRASAGDAGTQAAPQADRAKPQRPRRRAARPAPRRPRPPSRWHLASVSTDAEIRSNKNKVGDECSPWPPT